MAPAIVLMWSQPMTVATNSTYAGALPMKQSIKHVASATLTAAALSLLLAGPVSAATSTAVQPTLLAASETMNATE